MDSNDGKTIQTFGVCPRHGSYVSCRPTNTEPEKFSLCPKCHPTQPMVPDEEWIGLLKTDLEEVIENNEVDVMLGVTSRDLAEFLVEQLCSVDRLANRALEMIERVVDEVGRVSDEDRKSHVFICGPGTGTKQ